jgi:hypothetical protein
MIGAVFAANPVQVMPDQHLRNGHVGKKHLGRAPAGLPATRQSQDRDPEKPMVQNRVEIPAPKSSRTPKRLTLRKGQFSQLPRKQSL